MGVLRTLRRALIDRPFWVDHEAYLGDVRGVVHVGANVGQERKLYSRRGLRVAWVEPIPEVFALLESNIAGLPGQRAYKALITDVAGQTCTLNVASNKGGSSSILPMKFHAQAWPEVRFERQITITSDSLPTFMARHGLKAEEHDFLALDTQGSELMVLRGAGDTLSGFRYLKVEVPDFEAYEGCCQLPELQAFLRERGFVEHARHRFAFHPGLGSYYDIVYRRSDVVPASGGGR